MSKQYVRTTVDGINAMVGKAISLGTRGEVVEETTRGVFIQFDDSIDPQPIWLLNNQCEPWEKCHSCEMLRINGTVTHETGCPDAWRDEVRKCAWCGQKFLPENKYQKACSHSCEVAYSGDECNCEFCDVED
jgi:hypothetical protein